MAVGAAGNIEMGIVKEYTYQLSQHILSMAQAPSSYKSFYYFPIYIWRTTLMIHSANSSRETI